MKTAGIIGACTFALVGVVFFAVGGILWLMAPMGPCGPGGIKGLIGLLAFMLGMASFSVAAILTSALLLAPRLPRKP
jgi:hypothetical protein